MSFSYTTGSSAGTRDKLRLVIGDTTAASYVFEDEELDMFLGLENNDIYMTAAQAMRTIAVDAAKRAIFYRVTGFELDRRDPAKRLLEMANAFEKKALTTPFEFESVLEHDISAQGIDRSIYSDTPS